MQIYAYLYRIKNIFLNKNENEIINSALSKRNKGISLPSFDMHSTNEEKMLTHQLTSVKIRSNI